MGYKLAGYDVLGNCEIDKEMQRVYLVNNHPKFSFNMDIRDFRRLPNEQIPGELFGIDILDGSPPCSVFSMAGKREDGWGKEKVFREGQKKQTLDDLFFEFIELANRLKPKVVIAENVKGLICGNAKGYVKEICAKFKGAGYEVQAFVLNAALMGVPQSRERVFFVARRRDCGYPKIILKFSSRPIPFGLVREKRGNENMTERERLLMKSRRSGDKTVADIMARLKGNVSGFGSILVDDHRVCPTITSSGSAFRQCDGLKMTTLDMCHVQTFPEDYDFLGMDAKYICGMSVPPVMMAAISNEIAKQLFGVAEDEYES